MNSPVDYGSTGEFFIYPTYSLKLTPVNGSFNEKNDTKCRKLTPFSKNLFKFKQKIFYFKHKFIIFVVY